MAPGSRRYREGNSSGLDPDDPAASKYKDDDQTYDHPQLQLPSSLKPAANPFAKISTPASTAQPSGSSLFSTASTAQTNQQQPNTSSLFGNLGGNQTQPQPSSQPQVSSSLFSNLAGANQQQPSQQSQQQSSGGLFASTQPSQSLFGNLGTTNQAQTSQQQASSSGGLFGRVGASQSGPTTSLFASTQPQQQATTSGTLFGGTQSQQQSNSKPGSLFGGLGVTQNQQLGTQQPGTGSQAFGGSLLGGAGASQPQQTSATMQPLDQSQGTGATSQSAHFHTLLERGKKRQHATNGPQLTELPTLQLGLGDISSKVRDLGGSSTKGGRGTDSKASYLLAASGVPRGRTFRDIDAFAAQEASTAAASQPDPYDLDIDAYVNDLKAKSTQDLFREALEETNRDFDAWIEDNIQINWDLQRQRIYEHFGFARPSDRDETAEDGDFAQSVGRGSFGRSSRRGRPGGAETAKGSMRASAMSRSVLGGSISRGPVKKSLFTDVADSSSGASLSTPDDPFLRGKQDKYASKINELNASRLQEVVYPIIEQLAGVEIEAGSDAHKHLVDAYRALKAQTRETANAYRFSDPGAVKERQYAKEYLEDASLGRSSTIKKQILEGSRSFLEESFFNDVEELIAKNPKEANLGGVPSKINKIRAYLRIRASRKDLGPDVNELARIGEDYCWALIFYLLRAGLVQEAAQYVAEKERAIKSFDRNFPLYISAYARDPDRRLPREMQQQVNNAYQSRAKFGPETSNEPYRTACYKLIGRCELSKKNIEGINTSMEDWMWVLFALAREVNRVEEAAGDSFSLDDARFIVEEIGQRHFGAGAEGGSSGHATFFFLQVLAGMYEKAVASLYPHNYTAAVHFAIACSYYGLLRVSDFSVAESELLSYTSRDKPQISFARLLGYYTRDFRIAKAVAAADYLTLICLNSDLPGQLGSSQTAVCHEGMKELVLETREFAALLGDVRSDGKRIHGAIQDRLQLIKAENQGDFLRNLTLQAAGVADDSGRITDAVLLYHLADDYNQVIVVANRALSDALAVDLSQEQLRLQPLKPRIDPQENSNESQKDSKTSLSLTSVADPAILARNMMNLYDANAAYYQQIAEVNRAACRTLLQISEIKNFVQQGQWARAIDYIDGLSMLPLHAEGNISRIRSAAQAFQAQPPVVARNVGHLLTWTIIACGRQREQLLSRAFEASVKQIADSLVVAARDLMTFAGLIRYKLPADVFDVLARAGQDAGIGG